MMRHLQDHPNELIIHFTGETAGYMELHLESTCTRVYDYQADIWGGAFIVVCSRVEQPIQLQCAQSPIGPCFGFGVKYRCLENM